MKHALKFVMALTVTILLMLAFRALVFTVYTVRGTALEPCLVDGDRVLVNRWTYGLRTGDGRLFSYARWIGGRVGRGDLVVFNSPADTLRPVHRRETLAYYCTGVPGDTVTAENGRIVVPGKNVAIGVTPANAALIAYLYGKYEGRNARVSGGQLYVDGRRIECATFANDYYWFSSGRRSDKSDSRCFGFVPETFIIGKVIMLMYSVDGGKPVNRCLRDGRTFLLIRNT